MAMAHFHKRPLQLRKPLAEQVSSPLKGPEISWEITQFYTYIPTEQIRILIIISLTLNEFSHGKAQIPHRLV